ncbi:cobalamin biosynthesis protein CobQ [Sulfitobacter sp. S190]|uniref:cobalamin biosynthesis protein CobQ n=1 Tax=Sulfitobacter sp. S190 TaxID=2867022 RepID=UPI0021A7EF0B|nr:cobalamin biosynthesis protein CobQ [Sulfitobacter sp. S190]UWR23465.1 cobalamin biosynthesis protein CobQ [Sulfitobacter sp. S190]
MNTPAHLLIGGALMGRGRRHLIWAGMAGGLAPDVSLYVMAGAALFVLQIPPERVFNELYFSDAWQTVFAIDNSFLLWGGLLAVALYLRKDWAVAVTGAALVHLCLDFPLHHDDGRPHFWPVSNWIFESPVSYWDRAHGANWVGPIEVAIAAAAFVRIVTWRPGWAIGAGVTLLMLAELSVIRVWLFVFGL